MKKNSALYLTIVLTFMCLFSKAQTQVTFYTTKGNFIVEMYDTITPITSGNFVSLTNAKFYDGVIFHRVINNFMIQGGDPTGTGYGGPGYTIPDEFDSLLSNVQRTISMANTGAPNSGGSQFFINLVNNTGLDFDKPPYTSSHAVFGKVISNFSVVQDIGNDPTDSDDKPITDVVMDSLRVTLAGPLSINEVKEQIFSVGIFPNPVTSESNVYISSKEEKTANISVYNQQGQVIYRGQKQLLNGRNEIAVREFNETELSQGIYFLVVSDEKSITQKKFVILK